jgi:hypothetical protein
VERALYDRATRWIAREIAYEITYSKWGEQAARQRSNADDRRSIGGGPAAAGELAAVAVHAGERRTIRRRARRSIGRSARAGATLSE